MASFVNFVFAVILIVIWIAAGVLITQTNIYTRPYQDKDSEMKKAHTYSYWAAFITWFLIVLFVLLLILAIVGVVALFGSGAGEAGAVEAEASEIESIASNSSQIKSGFSIATILFLGVSIVLVSITGVLSALSASDLAASPTFDPQNAKLKKAYGNAVISSVLSLGAVGLLVIGTITYMVIREQKKKKLQRLILEEQTESA